jgi:hypothetical protein
MLRIAFFAFLSVVFTLNGAELIADQKIPNPRYTGSPFMRTWLAEDYGAHPENTCVLQQPRTGLVYVGNGNGVLEFDGVRWRLIATPTDEAVRSLCLDQKGRIWGCAGTTIFRLDPDACGELQARSMMERMPHDFREPRIIYQAVATSRGVYFRDLKNLFFFGDGEDPAQAWPVAQGAAVTLRLWQIDDEPYVTLGAPANVVVRRRGERFEPVPSLNSSVLAARAEADGSWQLSTVKAIQWWSGTELTQVRHPLGEVDAQHSVFLADGRIVVATANRGLVLCDRAGNFLRQIDRSLGLPANHVTGLATDREGGVWATLPYGIARVQFDSPYARHGPSQGVEGTIRSMARRGNELFAGGTEGVTRRGPDGQFRSVAGLPGPDREIVIHDGWLFSLSNRLRGVPLALGQPGRELENRNYYGLVPLNGAPGWYAHGSNAGLRWAHFAGDQWISAGLLTTLKGVPNVLLEAPAGVVWASSGAAGAWRVDFRGGLRADAPARTFGVAEGLPRRPTAMFILGGEIVALAAGKLHRYNAVADNFSPETRVAGLAGFEIEGAYPDTDGTVWLQGGPLSGREIKKLVRDAAPRSTPLENVEHWSAETLPGEPLRHLLTTALFHDTATQTLWHLGHGMLISNDLTWQSTLPPTPPLALIRRIETAAGELIAAGELSLPELPPVVLNPEQRALRISFAAPVFTTDHAGIVHTQYRTRLDGLELEWSPWSNQTERDLTHLPWRAFKFRVQARDDGGRVGPEATFAFSIRPPWWATRWAWLGYGLIGLLGFAGLVQLRTRKLHDRTARLEETVNDRTRDLARINAQLANNNAELARLHRLELDGKIAAQLSVEKARLEVLRYQLNPHFLYNALNSIYGLVFENPRNAGEMVLRLSEFCRSALTDVTDELPTLEAEISALRIYLDVEQVRWGNKLVIEIDLEPAVARIRLPQFLLLPLVENAIKYGGRTTPGVLRLRIRAFSAESRYPLAEGKMTPALVIEIANTGEWIPPQAASADSTGIGLENLRQRLQRYYPDSHEFTTTARDGWVIVRLRLERALSAWPAHESHP